MEKLKYRITINAPREKVWEILWNDDTYRKWTSAFSEGSHAVTDWKEGSQVLFLDSDGRGMVSRIARSIPNEYMSFEHLGEVNGAATTEAANWAGAKENYTLKAVDGKTELSMDMDIEEEYKEMFSKMWPIALDNIKRLAES